MMMVQDFDQDLWESSLDSKDQGPSSLMEVNLKLLLIFPSSSKNQPLGEGKKFTFEAPSVMFGSHLSVSSLP